MNPREAFRVFIRFQLEMMNDDGKIDLTPEQIEKVANGIENDATFHEELEDFLDGYIADFGDNYDL